MKKTYQQPAVVLTQVKMVSSVLAGSEPQEYHHGFNSRGMTAAEDISRARLQDVWYDEEEEADQ